MIIIEEDGVRAYLQKRQLTKAYLKVKTQIEAGQFLQADFKKRQPKSLEAYQFRITKKYRAYGYFLEENTFLVTEISDHQ